MANDAQQNTQNQQAGKQSGNPGNQSGTTAAAQGSNQAGAQGGAEQRSEGLLPAGEEDDGRFEVAEEVSLDQQSDQLRQVGQIPEDVLPEVRAVEYDPDAALGKTLPDPGKQSDG